MKRAPDLTLQAITYEKNEIESGLLIMMLAKRILEGESLVFEQVRTTVFFMPPISQKLRGHIGLGRTVRLSVCLSVHPSVCNTLWQLGNSRTAYARTLKVYMWHVHEK